MGGRYPSAGSEFNFESDSPGFHALFLEWTKENGYPPVYLNGLENGAKVVVDVPPNALPGNNPTAYAMQLVGVTQQRMWDALSLLFAARGREHHGTTYFTVSAPGTVFVDAVTGADAWSPAPDSGHHVLTIAAPAATSAAFLDSLLAQSDR
jgi:hypothetical protein